MTSYFKREDETTTFYYNTSISPFTEIREKEGVFKVVVSKETLTWITEHAGEIDAEQFDEKAEQISEWCRLGTHPPCPPGGC